MIIVLGRGGVDKTRLALEVGVACGSTFLNGVWLVPLARLDGPALLSWAMADALG